jgi:hypothetical protein
VGGGTGIALAGNLLYATAGNSIVRYRLAAWRRLRMARSSSPTTLAAPSGGSRTGPTGR